MELIAGFCASVLLMTGMSILGAALSQVPYGTPVILSLYLVFFLASLIPSRIQESLKPLAEPIGGPLELSLKRSELFEYIAIGALCATWLGGFAVAAKSIALFAAIWSLLYAAVAIAVGVAFVTGGFLLAIRVLLVSGLLMVAGFIGWVLYSLIFG